MSSRLTALRAARPCVEALEDRDLLSGSPFLAAGTPFPKIGADSKPGVIITVLPGGKISKTLTGQGPYDGIEDTYVGVVNPSNSGVVLKNLTLSGSAGSPIFDLDGDGIQTFGVPSSYTLPPLAKPYYQGALAQHDFLDNHGVTGYEGPGTYFDSIDFAGRNSGKLIFDDGNGNGLKPGQETFFSLEETPTSIGAATINSLPTTAISLLASTPVIYNPASNTLSFLAPLYNLTNTTFTGSVSIIFHSNNLFNEPFHGLVPALTPQSSIQLVNGSGFLLGGDPFANFSITVAPHSVVYHKFTFTAGIFHANALGAFVIPGFSMQFNQGVTL
jgi:hypothetical protein